MNQLQCLNFNFKYKNELKVNSKIVFTQTFFRFLCPFFRTGVSNSAASGLEHLWKNDAIGQRCSRLVKLPEKRLHKQKPVQLSWRYTGLPDAIFSYQKYHLRYNLEGLRMENVGIFMVISNTLRLFGVFCGHLVYFLVIWYIFGHLVYFLVIWYIFWSFGIFFGHLVYFVVIWYIFTVLVYFWSFGIFCGHLVYFVVIW
jgi:hypothetical protein